jgi:putative membrane protein
MLRYQPHPDVWLLVVALYGGYLYALSSWGPRSRSSAPVHDAVDASGPRFAPGRRAATRNQIVCFTLGVAVIWIAADYPVHDLAEEYLYSVHMLQHLAFQLIAPPLLILGTPGWLLRRLLSPRPVAATVRAITKPLAALVIVNAFVAVQHTPLFVNATVRNGALHLLAHIAVVGFSLLMWWPVLSPLPELPHLSYPARMAYLFAHSIIPTVPASFLTFTNRALYETYASFPRIVDVLDPVQDQQLAGLEMKILGGLFLWIVIAVLFFRWHHEEETGGPDVLYWRDLEHDLGQRELTHT